VQEDEAMIWNGILSTSESGWTVLVRLLVGLCVFLPEGIQKLAFADVLGAGRFTKIGIPFPGIVAPFVGTVEIVCGSLIILGLFTRLAAIPLIIIMIVALVSTKVPILLGHDVWIFHLAQDIKRTGLWSTMHESRADLTMLFACVYLLIVGAGRWSLDARLARWRSRGEGFGGCPLEDSQCFFWLRFSGG
jgi:putative oxidoreductase